MSKKKRNLNILTIRKIVREKATVNHCSNHVRKEHHDEHCENTKIRRQKIRTKKKLIFNKKNRREYWKIGKWEGENEKYNDQKDFKAIK